MAILFVSPQKTQKIFMAAVTFLVIVFLIGFSLIIFWPQFLFNNSNFYLGDKTYQTPDLRIDFGAVDSPQFKNLKLFSEAQIEFNYIAKDETDKQIMGVIMAIDENNARIILGQMGLKLVSLEEKNIGRSQPFIPYY